MGFKKLFSVFCFYFLLHVYLAGQQVDTIVSAIPDSLPEPEKKDILELGAPLPSDSANPGVSLPVFPVESVEMQSDTGVLENRPDTSGPSPLVSFKDTVVLAFSKYKTEISEDRRLFNVLTITNFFSIPVEGNLKITVPDTWRLLATDAEQRISIEPGGTVQIPLSVTMPAKLSGGKAFPISAKFSASDKKKYFTSCYIQNSIRNDFSLSSDRNVIYFNSITGMATFKLKLSNRGNVPELIKVNFKMGKLLTVQGLKRDSDFIYIELPEGRDSTLLFSVDYRQPSPDEMYLESRISEGYLNILALSGGDKRKSTSIWFKNIPHLFYNDINEMNGAPLSVALFFNNLLGSSPLSGNLNIGGGLLLNNNSSLNYFFNIYNLQFNENYYKGLSFGEFYMKHLRSGISYSINRPNSKTTICLGDRVSSRYGGVSGRGISAVYAMKKQEVSASLTKNIYSPVYGASLGYSGKIGILPRFSIGAGVIQNNLSKINAQTLSFSSSLPAIYHHTLGYSFAFHNNLPQAGIPVSATQGWAYRFSLGAGFPKLNYSFSYGNNTKNYFFYNAFYSVATGSAQYQINNTSRITFDASHRQNKIGDVDIKTSRFSSYRVEMGRLIYFGRLSPTITYQAGPYFENNERISNHISDKFSKTILSHSERINLVLNKRITSAQSLSPFLKIGFSTISEKYHYYILDTLIKQKSPPLFNFNAGLSYNLNRNFSFNLSYYYGPYFFWNQIDALNSRVYSKSVRLTPVYRKTFFTKMATINLVSSGNYSLEMPRNNEQITFNLLSDFLFYNGWSCYLNMNAYFSSRYVPEQKEKIAFRNYNLGFGVRKTFDLQQPRIKYYDLKLVFFKDLNGNGAREENEPLMNNILVQIERIKSEKTEGRFVQTELLSNVNGETIYKNIPEGNYMLQISSLTNLVDLYCQNGNKQNISISENLTYYIPFVQSYTVSGKIILERDEFSSLGTVDIANIRVTATSLKGDNYQTLTGKDGSYIINIPQSGFYKVRVNNIFGTSFETEEDEVLLDFNGLKAYIVDFKFREKKRTINFNGNGNGNHTFKFGNGRIHDNADSLAAKTGKIPKDSVAKSKMVVPPVTPPDNSKAKDSTVTTPVKLPADTAAMDKKGTLPETPAKNDKAKETGDAGTPSGSPIDKSQIKFKVQIGAFNTEVSNDVIEKIKQLPNIKESQTEEGLLRFTAGEFSDYQSAMTLRQELISKGLSTDTTFVIIIADYKGRVFSADEAKELLKD